MTVAWDGLDGVVTTTFHVDNWPSFKTGDEFEVDYNPSHPLVNVVPDPSVFSNVPYRIFAVVESLALVTFAVLLLALLVVWPVKSQRGSRVTLSRNVKSALRRYVATPGMVSVVALAAAITTPDLATCSSPAQAVAMMSALLLLALLVWLVVRAVRCHQLVRLAVGPDDAADPCARVAWVRGHRLRIEAAARRLNADTDTPDDIRVSLLRGQATDHLRPGELVRLYGLRGWTGPVLLTASGADALVGFGTRLVRSPARVATRWRFLRDELGVSTS